MAGFGRGTAILISIMAGLIILPFLGIKGLFSIVIIGFIANYLTVDSQRSYKIGAIAGCTIGLIVFLFGFFVSPVLPDLPNLSSSKMIKLELGGLFTLIMGFFVLLIACTGFGTIGGAIVQKLFKAESKTEDYKKRDTPKKSFNKYLKLILNKNKPQRSFNNMPKRNLGKNRISFNNKPKKTLGKNKSQKKFNNKSRRKLNKK
ncbi:hypothetical protein [Methanobacterium sp.]|uniref:hypothetical protein n=1 Tax=Methanobacterium sp. TaxID=2164 RepID=UPI003C73D67D